MKYRLLLTAWLVVVWFALWRDISVANLVSGLVVAVTVVWLFAPHPPTEGLRIRPLAFLRFLGASAASIVRANVVVAWEVVTPTNQINEGVVAVDLASRHPVVITLISHAIILAPGTMVIDVEDGDDTTPTRLYVHVLHLREVEHVRDEILHLEQLALAALAAGEASS